MGNNATGGTLPPFSPRLKGRLPFRLGTSSYILPGPVLPNVRVLAPVVDDIQILLYEFEGDSNYPSSSDVREIAALGRDNGLTFSVHLPLLCRFGSPDVRTRRASVDACLRLRDLLTPLTPWLFATHLDTEDPNGIEPSERAGWEERTRQSITELVAGGFAPASLCVETLGYPLTLADAVIRDCALSVCMDVGHCVLYGHPAIEWMRRYGPAVRMFHVHGVRAGVDHEDMAALDPVLLRAILAFLAEHADARRLFEIEVFDADRLSVSLAVLERACVDAGLVPEGG